MNSTLWPSNFWNTSPYFSTELIFIVVLGLQLVITLIDEFYFHHRRGLPQWERWGHPLDSLTVLICFGYVLIYPWSPQLTFHYSLLTVFSCLFITKDEWVHTTQCRIGENYLHALLYILHPIVFISLYQVWKNGAFTTPLLYIFCAGVLFTFYQLIYWNFLWKPKSTTPSMMN